MARLQNSILAFFVAGLTVSCSAPRETPPPPQAAAVPKPDPVERGQYLVKIMGCNDCHTPLKFGPEGPMPSRKRPPESAFRVMAVMAAQVGVRAGICMMAVPTRIRAVRARIQAAVETAPVP